jgi:hypothetical protein
MEFSIMDMSVVVSLAQFAQSTLEQDPFGCLVVYPSAILTSALMIWAGLQSNSLAVNNAH